MELFQLIGKIAINSQDAIRDIEGTTEKASGLGTKMKAGIVTAAKWGTAIAAGAAAAGALRSPRVTLPLIPLPSTDAA